MIWAMLEGGVQLDWQLNPLEVLSRWPVDQGIFMLHSARRDATWSRYTVIAEPTEAIRHKDGQSRLSQPDSALAKSITLSHQPFDDLQKVFDADNGQSLWLGTLGYDLARAIEQLPEPAEDDRGWPDFQLERCAGWLVYDNQTQQWFAHGQYAQQPPTFITAAAAEPNPAGETPGTAPQQSYQAGPIAPDQPREQVEQSIQRAIDYIAAGDVFQVNLAQRFSGPFCGSTRAFYTALSKASPAWYGAYGELTRFEGDTVSRTLASISPELFLDCDSTGKVTTRPIKGTRPSHIDPDELINSEKDRAELAMIVDLMRNDLGRVCAFGSVRVDEARTIESHPTVHHGVATITGKLHREQNLTDLLRATMPGGSITGAPKVRAMQIIDQLEPARRGAYCGAIGMICGATAQLNIAIRTVMIEQGVPGGAGRADVWAGGGIVADSDPKSEYEEMLAKARAMRESLESAPRHLQAASINSPAATNGQRSQ